MHSRRQFLTHGGAAFAALAVGAAWALPARAAQAAGGRFEINRTEAEWKKRLSPEQYEVLRQSGTERPYTSALLKEQRKGVYTCAGCQLALFSSATKFESGTGWPSFWAPLDGAIATEKDSTFGMVRTSVHCHRCGGHLGHVFDDGPKPTGLRYCMNGVAMGFSPAQA